MTHQEMVETLMAWGEMGRVTAQHIIECDDCREAERHGDKGYCAAGDKLWAAQMQTESRVMAMLPELKAMGIDVDTFCRDAHFQFYKKQQP